MTLRRFRLMLALGLFVTSMIRQPAAIQAWDCSGESFEYENRGTCDGFDYECYAFCLSYGGMADAHCGSQYEVWCCCNQH